MGDLYTKVVSNAIFPLQELAKKHSTVAVKKAMEKSQWWTPEKLDKWRVERLRSFLVGVDINVPYYQNLFKEVGFDPRSVTSLADISGLPLLTKEKIRNNTEQLKSIGARDLSQFNTGGSSGEPLIFYLNNERVSHDVAAKWRATRWWGVDIGDPEIVVWGSPIENASQNLIKSFRDKLMRTQLISAFEMSERSMADFVDDIKRKKTKMIFGYPSALALLADYVIKNGNDVSVSVAFVTAERLYEDQREKIERAFGCRVANGYGGRDAGFICHECPDGGMHITAEDIIVEIVDGEGKTLPVGESGEIVVTHMATSGFPFIRYQTGDVGVLSEDVCRCGRGLPIMKEIQGRTTDFIVAHDGTIMHGLALIYDVRKVIGIKNYKIVQHSKDKVSLQLVVDERFVNNSIGEITESFKQRLGEGVEIDVDLVDEIPLESSGKHRFVVNKMPAYRGGH